MSKQHTDNSIIVVGGGSAGWITALYLQQYFNQARQQYSIKVIESAHQGPIGVGEATVHSIRFLFAALQLDEKELMRRTNATLKLGILFKQWMKPTGNTPHQYFHPFEQQQVNSHLDIATHWLLGDRKKHQRYDQGVSVSGMLAKRGLSAKARQHSDYQGYLPYAYHIDAVLLGEYLKEVAIARGVSHAYESVEKVNCDGEYITSISTRDANHNAVEHKASFFVDCTGFKGLLINALKQNNWVTFKRELPCDKAVAIQCDYENDHAPRPYTTATALNYGWCWQIDLANRQGNGYVYDSQYISPTEAENELRARLGVRAQNKKALHIDMKVGRLQETWIGNCVAIGLSGGFIEPLESTGLHLINLAARLFATHFSTSDATQVVRDNYNQKMVGVYEDLKQFIVLHYCLTDRNDTAFWQQAQQSANFQAGLPEKLALWRQKVCEYMDLAGGYSSTFNDENYRYVLYGMQHYPSLHLASDATTNDQWLNEIDKRARNLCLQAPSHQEFLSHLHQR